MEKLYFEPERYGDHYAILPKDSVKWSAYGESDVSYIHAKWGRLKKAYWFTKAFEKKYPEFVAEYKKYWNDESGAFKTGMDVADYLIAHPDIGAEVHPYFNFIDEWADGWEAIKTYLEQEAKTSDDPKLPTVVS